VLRTTVAARKTAVKVGAVSGSRGSRGDDDVWKRILSRRGGEGGAGWVEAAFEIEEKTGKEEVGEDERGEEMNEPVGGGWSVSNEYMERRAAHLYGSIIVWTTRTTLAKLIKQIARTYSACRLRRQLIKLVLLDPFSASAFSVDQCCQLAKRVRKRTVCPKTAGETKVMLKTEVVGVR
jgi:hypothetical protein